MKNKICVGKKVVYVIFFITLVVFVVTLLSSTLLKRKTTYQSKAAQPQSKPSIYGGTEVDQSEWSFVVKISIDNFGDICSGTLIAPQWVLTAAHCVWNLQPKGITVYVNTPNNTDNRTTLKPFFVSDKGVYVNQYYNDVNMANDIALLHLSKKVDKQIKPVKINTSSQYEREGKITVVLGFGTTDESLFSPYMLGSTLHKGVMPMLSNGRVIRWGKDEGFEDYVSQIFPSSITSGYPNGGVSACNGDSGGPLILWNGYRWVQDGVTSWSMKGKFFKGEPVCAIKKKPLVSTRLNYSGPNYADTSLAEIDYRKWIGSIVGSDLPQNDIEYFIGSPLTSDETAEYNRRICDKTEWAGSPPTYYCQTYPWAIIQLDPDFHRDDTNKLTLSSSKTYSRQRPRSHQREVYISA